MAMGRRPRPAIERFARQSQITPSGCVEWVGSIDRYGYGQFRPGGRETTNMGAHRWSYEYFIGPIPAGLHIDHLCRNRACVNAAHLEPVTPRENVMRSPIAPAALNARKTHCHKGHLLSPDNVYQAKTGRACKTCVKANSAINYQKRKAS